MEMLKKDESYCLFVKDRSYGVIRTLFESIKVNNLLGKSEISIRLVKTGGWMSGPGELRIGKCMIKVAHRKGRKKK